MSRLYDEIKWNDDLNDEVLRQDLGDVKVFDITKPTHDFLLEEHDFSYSPESYYQIKPPFAHTFFEFKISKELNQLLKDKYNLLSNISRIGFRIMDLGEFDSEHGFFFDNDLINGTFYVATGVGMFDGELEHLGSMSFAVGGNIGKPLKFTHSETDSFKYNFFNYDNKIQGNLLNFSKGPIFYSLQLVNCSNTIQKDHSPSDNLAKKQEKTKGTPQTIYKTIHIDPNSKGYKSSCDNSQENRNKRRQHFVRGHFRHFKSDYWTEEKQGTTTWIPPHVRGDDENGAVKKDYEVSHA